MASPSINRRRVIALIALTAVILVTLDVRDSALTNGLRNTFGVVFRPVEGVARVVTRPVSNVWSAMAEYGDLLEENALLREKIAQQEGASVAAAASVRLAQELLALNGLPTLAGINSVTAQVIGESPTNFSQTVEINQGSSSGVRVGMPVLNAAGLVGKVTRVFSDRAVVMLVTDPSYSLSIKVINEVDGPVTPVDGPGDQLVEVVTTTTSSTTTTTVAPIPGFTPGTLVPATTVAPRPGVSVPSLTVPQSDALAVRETGVLEGRGPTRVPIVRFIDNAQRFGRVQVGSPIVTAGGSLSLAPPDILVGTVSRVTERLGTAGPILEIDLVADLSNLSFVRILLYQPISERQAP